jgi:hypothetical protein
MQNRTYGWSGGLHVYRLPGFCSPRWPGLDGRQRTGRLAMAAPYQLRVGAVGSGGAAPDSEQRNKRDMVRCGPIASTHAYVTLCLCGPRLYARPAALRPPA